MKIRACIDTADCLEILRAAGISAPSPKLPNNTAWEPFTTADGLPAVVIVQTAFRPQGGEAQDDVNGLTILIGEALPGAPDFLENYLHTQLGIGKG